MPPRNTARPAAPSDLPIWALYLLLPFVVMLGLLRLHEIDRAYRRRRRR